MWVLLWGTYDLANVFTGIGVALLVLIALPLPRVPVEGRIHPLTLLELVGRLIAAFFISSAQVAWAAIRPAKPPLSAVLRARLAIKSDMVLTLAVDYLNLVPGTMVVEIDHSRRLLYVHLFDASSPEKVKAFYRQIETIERLFIRGFERDHEWRASPYHGIDDDLSAGDYPREESDDLCMDDRGGSVAGGVGPHHRSHADRAQHPGSPRRTRHRSGRGDVLARRLGRVLEDSTVVSGIVALALLSFVGSVAVARFRVRDNEGVADHDR